MWVLSYILLFNISVFMSSIILLFLLYCYSIKWYKIRVVVPPLVLLLFRIVLVILKMFYGFFLFSDSFHVKF